MKTERKGEVKKVFIQIYITVIKCWVSNMAFPVLALQQSARAFSGIFYPIRRENPLHSVLTALI